MQIFKQLILASVLTGLLVQSVHALEVDREVVPRMTIGGRVISTLDSVDMDSVDMDSDPGAKEGINLSDSAILMRFDKRTYRDGVAGAVVGIKEHEDAVAFHELHAFYWNRNYRFELGRTRLRNTLLELPLIRDDDLMDYTHVGNASSNEEFDQIYGETAAFDWYLDRKIQALGLWAGTRRNGDPADFPDAPDGFDSYGAGYVYQQPEDLLYVKRIRHAGVLLDRQKVNTAGGDEWLNAAVAGIEFNLNMNPINNWSLGLQTIYNNGVDNAQNLGSVASRARAKSTSLVTSVRYTGRPKLLTRWQGAITAAVKDFSDVDQATQWSIAPNAVYRIGQGVDVFAQLKYTDYGDGLGGGSDTVVQLGMAFSLEAMFNDNIGERDSILNLEHGYIH
ncbi:MAG: hypothetical protein LJE85_12370 [Gammaproteobacteria bacterium]|nr:hypothetical protein [Gammaproteobacteria bacterium]